jgi:hypothetical protein
MTDPRTRPQRQWDALARLTERHGSPGLLPYDAARHVLLLASGAAAPGPDEPAVDHDDLTAALTLIGHVRAELDALEFGLFETARHRGLTWQAIAHGIGLGSAQAAKQRRDRLAERTPDPS